ncbi:hypothetical protein [Enterococcus saccharolyticus]|uniref:BD-FAE-like domain-containing protein n=1 Tax=Enterococcus saccharolyticus subsp. saccharolyticus ATCC 43076 TaxID=1139996 RepID=S0JEA2_9ENTE|nr:hypothetical protein [Enterococcus saccharolyticus]EOT30597.1 hypothetical protein OMQ_00301 [Enterococcus saccharolyticus subsp. saccharolyticus ATCC 43076]EOT80158.1 hypothetical protein I572_00683 [Enterococcus saccharolyticus subsp. saccharolyticus ATCC 43076]OJG87969.1 hypothetical protein RV16_GL000490 [Enterococcus saccharolyticus]
MHRDKPVINLLPKIVYGHRMEGSNAVYRPLSLSLMRPRMSFPYDEKHTNLPVIIWLFGGSFSAMDRNVWTPELAWFAKRGYAVASIDYSVTARAKFPDQIEDVKLAIRYLKAQRVPAELYIFEGAEHADAPFTQEETKQLIFEFLQRVVD